MSHNDPTTKPDDSRVYMVANTLVTYAFYVQNDLHGWTICERDIAVTHKGEDYVGAKWVRNNEDGSQTFRTVVHDFDEYNAHVVVTAGEVRGAALLYSRLHPAR